MRYIAFFILFGSLLSCHSNRQKESIAKISSLPSFQMLLMDSITLFDPGQVPEGKPIVVMYFRPNCPHCQEETKTFVKNIEDLKTVRIYMLAGADFKDLKEFYQSYHLDQYQNITVGKDYEHSFARVFRPKAVPYMAIYNTKKNLVRVYYGEVKIHALLDAVHI